MQRANSFPLPSRSLWLTLGILAVFVGCFYLYVHAEKQIDRANALSLQSHLLAEELRQSSADLTQMVRGYVITGDRRYKQYFQEILDIRDGKRPRPLDYHVAYWDLVLADGKPQVPGDGPAIALLDSMRQAGFSDAEFALLAEAKANSDALAGIESAAMKLIEAHDAPTDADRIKASWMLRDASYFQAKAAIMRPISAFYRMMDQRTLQAVQAAETAAARLRVAFMAAGLVLIAAVCNFYLGSTRIFRRLLKKRSDALQKSELRFRSTFDAAPIGVTNSAIDGRLLAVNQGYCAMLGYSADELQAMTYQQFTAPEYQALDAEMISRTLAGEMPEFNHEKQYIRKNGERVWCHIWVKLIRDANGLPDYFIGVIENIDRRKRAELAFQDANNLLKSIIASVPVRLFWKDRDLRYIGCNLLFAKDAGFSSPDQVIGKTDYDMVWKGRAREYRNDDLAVIASGSIRLNYEEPLITVDNRLIWVQTSKAPLRNDQGRIIGMLGVYQDITEAKRNVQALRKFKNIIESTDDAVISKSLNGVIDGWNAGAEKIFGYSAREVIGRPMQMLIPDAYLEDEANIMATIARGDYVKQYETVRRHQDGRLVDIAVTVSPILDDNGDVIGASTIARDISARKQTDLEIKIASTAFESAEGMIVTDENGIVLRVNKAFTEITGYSADEMVGQNPRLLKSDRQDADFYAKLWATLLCTGSWQGEIWNRRKNGEVYPEYLTITAVRNATGTLSNYVATLVDITVKKQAEDAIKRLAFYDPLTRLPNRQLLRDRLQRTLASVARSGLTGGLLFIDLDNFKSLNDTRGHNVGDLLLQQVAERLEACMREGDTVARLGGDEFVVMLENLSKDPAVAAELAEIVGNKILATLNQPYQLAGHAYRNTPSIGATLFNNNRYSLDELMQQADIAMYQSKKAGRNTLRFFDPQMQRTVNARALLEKELQNAVENGQLQLYYQVQVEGGTGSHRPIGAEALVRWLHPLRGLVSPAEFIPLAEETGVILAIGRWVLDVACAQLKIWQQEPLTSGLVLAVNVSSKQFRQAGFVGQIRSLIQRHRINPLNLKLELTESLLLENIEETIVTMNALTDMGVQFSLDDFGAGYSSLQYLKRLPLYQLKIDRSFVRDIATDSSDKAIVRTIIAMADTLNINVIAEGVETEEQQKQLLQKGCTRYQGFLFGKPMPIESFDAFLRLNGL